MRRSAAHDRECLSLPYGWAPRSCGGGLCARGAKRRRKAGTWGGEGGARGARARAREKEGERGRPAALASVRGLDPDSVALCLGSLLTTIAASSPPITAAIALHGMQAQAGRRLLRPTGRDPGLLLHHRRPAGQARERERERERSYRPHATLVPPTSCRSGQRERERESSYCHRVTLVPPSCLLALHSRADRALVPHLHPTLTHRRTAPRMRCRICSRPTASRPSPVSTSSSGLPTARPGSTCRGYSCRASLSGKTTSKRKRTSKRRARPRPTLLVSDYHWVSELENRKNLLHSVHQHPKTQGSI